MAATTRTTRRSTTMARATAPLGDTAPGDGDGDGAAAALAAALAAAATAEEVRAILGALHQHEAALGQRLQGLAGRQGEVQRALLRLDGQRAALGAQAIAVRGVAAARLAGAAGTAARLSTAVRGLDVEKARVEATLRVVEQVAELKACVAGVAGSMGAPQDWEAAAAYLARARRIPAAIVGSGFARAVVPTVEVPDAPAATLEAARASLCGLFLREFERAAADGDDARVTRFFKLFPLIGRADVGLDVYGRYVCQGVAAAARAVFRAGDDTAAQPSHSHGQGSSSRHRDPLFYANALAKLFSHIAQIVESHGALVARHYGAGQMGTVLRRLQNEADVQGGILVDAWSDDRAIDRKLTDVKSYPFSFLLQSFLAMQRGAAGSNGAGSGGGGGGGGADDAPDGSPRPSEDEGGVSMREVDGLLTEMAAMLSRWSLYARFLAGKSGSPAAAAAAAAEETADAPPPDGPPLPDVVAQSSLQRKVAARLVAPYSLMSTFFFRRSVEKAFQLEEAPGAGDLTLDLARPLDSNPPYILSAVDDVLYMASAVVQRSLATLQRDVVVAVVPPVGRVLGSDFVGMIQRKMRDEAYPRALVHGGFPPEDRIVAFVVLLNSLDMAVAYLARIVSTGMGAAAAASDDNDDDAAAAAAASPDNDRDPPRVPSPSAPAVLAHLRQAFPFGRDAALVAAALAALFASFAATAAELQTEGLQVLFNQVVKARLRPVLVDTFRDADYALTEAERAAAAADGDDRDRDDRDVGVDDRGAGPPPVGRRFARGWDALMRPLARLLTPRAYAHLADLAARYLARVLEKRVWAHVGRASPDGAVRLERDVHAIVAAVARGARNYGARELFAKTAQILMVANMEDDEWDELAAADDDDDAMVWLLSEDERRRARNMVRRV